MFSFFEVNRKVGSDFKAMYDIHMRVEALSKDLVFFNKIDIFHAIPPNMASTFEIRL